MHYNNLYRKLMLKILNILCLARTRSIREFYWSIRSDELKNIYDASKSDYKRISEVISNLNVLEIHDLGCGPGRLIDLWSEVSKEVTIILTDISLESINIARSKKSRRPILYTQLDLVEEDLIPPKKKPSLAVINKVLGALNEKEVNAVLNKLMRNYTYIYLCENFISDLHVKNSIGWRVHDYKSILEKLEAQIIVNNHDYLVFKGREN